MSLNNVEWSVQTKKIFLGVLLYSLAGILYAILDPIESLTSSTDTLMALSGAGGLSGASAFTIILYVLMVGILAGYVLFFVGLSGFVKVLEGNDSAALGKVRTGVILVLIATLVDFIPLMGWVSIILNIIAYILMLIGYASLKDSATFPEKARKGASNLFVALILLVVGAVISFIPFVGGGVSGVLSVIAFVLVLVGWAAIKNAQPSGN